MLFASFGDFGDPTTAMVGLAFLLFGAGRAVKMISGNSTARTATKKGAGYLIRQLFK